MPAPRSSVGVLFLLDGSGALWSWFGYFGLQEFDCFRLGHIALLLGEDVELLFTEFLEECLDVWARLQVKVLHDVVAIEHGLR